MNVDNLTTEECMMMPEPAYTVTFSYDCSGDVQILPDSSNVNPSDVPSSLLSSVKGKYHTTSNHYYYNPISKR
jgi:hypothetical protein